MAICRKMAAVLLVVTASAGCDPYGTPASVALEYGGSPADLTALHEELGYLGLPYVRGYSILEDLRSGRSCYLQYAGQDAGDGVLYGPSREASRSPGSSRDYVWWLRVEGYDQVVVRPFRRDVPAVDLVPAAVPVLCREIYGVATTWQTCTMTVAVSSVDGVPDGIQLWGSVEVVEPTDEITGTFTVEAVAGSASGAPFSTDVIVTAPGYNPFVACIPCDGAVNAMLEPHNYASCAVVRAAPSSGSCLAALGGLLLGLSVLLRRRRRLTE